jgi:hypothetical protein
MGVPRKFSKEVHDRNAGLSTPLKNAPLRMNKAV